MQPRPTLDDPFTLILTVPRALVGDDVDPTLAVDPVLAARFGWGHYDVLDPQIDEDAYERAFETFRAQATSVELVDPAKALVHVVPKEAAPDDAGSDLFMRVVRLFPEGFPVGVCSPVVGQA